MRPSTDSTSSDSILGDASLEEILRTIGLYDQSTQDLASDGAITPSETCPTTIDPRLLTCGVTEPQLGMPLGYTPTFGQLDGTTSSVPFISAFGGSDFRYIVSLLSLNLNQVLT